MSGILIDVNAETGNASKGLADINRQLAELIRNSQTTNSLLGKLNLSGVREATTATNQATSAFQKLGSAGSTALRTITAPARSLVSVLTSVPTLLSAIAVGFAAIRSTNSFYKAADELTAMQNKLKLVVKSSDELANTQYRLYNLSKQTYSSQQEAVDVYFNLARAMAGTSTSTKELLEYTKTIQQTIAVSGVSAQSASAALLQLNQGISSGTLRGEELNSVLEQLPRLGLALTKTLGMSSGQLRKFAEEGKLTTELLLGVLREQSAAIDSEFNPTVRTAAQAFDRLGESTKYFFQSVNGITHSSGNLSKLIVGVADNIDLAARNIIPSIYIAKQHLRNYIDTISMFEATVLTWRALSAAKIGILDLWGTWKEYQILKDRINTIREFIGLGKNDIKIKAKIEVDEGRFNIVNKVKGLRGKKEELKEKVPTDLGKIFEDTFRIAVAGFEALSALTSKFHWLIPDIRGPVKTFRNDMNKFFRQMYTDIYAWSLIVFRPYTRNLEAVYQYMTLFTKGDQDLERAFVDVFNSDSVESLIENLYDLRDAANTIRFNNFSILINDVISMGRRYEENFKEVLRYFDIIDNRLLFVNNVRFDRAIGGLMTFASVAKRVFDDIIFPRIAPSLMYFYLSVKASIEAFLDAVKDNFNFNTGEAMGRSLVVGFTRGITAIVGYIKSFSKYIKETLTEGSNSIGPLLEKFKTATVVMLHWLVGFVIGLFKSIAHSIEEAIFSPFEIAGRRIRSLFVDIFTMPKIVDSLTKSIVAGATTRKFSYAFNIDPTPFQVAVHYIDDMLLRIVTHSYDMLSRAEMRIRRFGIHVKDTFFDIYDKVVGHSFWPDMIDAVNSYTEQLFKSESFIGRFAAKVKKIFSSVYEAIRDSGGSAKELYQNVTVRLEKIEWGTVGNNLRQVLSATMVAALLYAFGGTTAKVIAADFILSTLGDELLSFVGKIPDAINENLGESIGFITSTIVNSFYKVLDGLIGSLPTFVKSLLDGLGPIGKFVSDLLSIGPSNGLLYTLLFGAGIVSWKFKDGFKMVKEIVMGAEPNKKKGKEGHGGLIDYIPALFTDTDTKVSTGFLSNTILGSNPKLLLAGIATVSTAYLKSVSLMESSLLGVPMIMMALFGKDAGGLMIRRFITKFIPETIGLVYDAIRSSMAKMSFFSLFVPILDFFPSLFGKISASLAAGKTSGPLATAATTLGSNLIQVLKNAKTNALAYATDNMSIADLFLYTHKLGGGDQVPLKKSFSTFLQQLMSFDVAGISLNSIKNSIKTLYLSISTYVVELFSQGGAGRNLITSIFGFSNTAFASLKGMLGSVAQGFMAFFATIGNGFKGLFSLLFSKLGIFLALVAGFASMAQASNIVTDGLAEVGTQLKTVLTITLSLTAALYALGKAYAAYEAFREARIVFARGASAGVDVSPSVVASAKAAFDASMLKTGNVTGALKTAKAAEEAVKDAAVKKAFNDAFDSTAGIKAGFDGLKDSIKGTVNQLYGFFRAIADGAIGAGKWLFNLAGNTIFNAYWWYKVTYASGYFFAMMQRGLIATWGGAKLVGAAFMGISTVFAAITAGGLMLFIKGIFEAIKTLGLIPGLIESGFTRLAAFLSWLRTAALFIISIKGLIVGLVVGTVGALGLWLFGPGGTLLESIEYYKDKIAGLFGATATGRVAREGALREALADTKIGDTTVSFKSELDKIDVNKLSKADYAIIEKAATTTRETIDKMREFYVLQGQLTAEQLEEWKTAERVQRQILANQPVKDPISLEQSADTLSEKLTSVDDSFLSKLERLFKYATSDLGNSLTASLGQFGTVFIPFFREGLQTFGVAIDDFLFWVQRPIQALKVGKTQEQVLKEEIADENAPTAWGGVKLAWKLATAEINTTIFDITEFFKGITTQKLSPAQINDALKARQLTADVNLYGKKLTEDEKKQYQSAQQRYGDANEALRMFEEKNKNRTTPIGTGKYAPTYEGYKKQLADLKAEADSSRNAFEILSKALEDVGRRRTELEQYTKMMTALGVKAKEFFDISLGVDSRDWLGSDKDTTQLREFVEKYSDAVDNLRTLGKDAESALKIKIDMADTKRLAKELEDESKAFAFLGTRFEYQIKVTGVETTKDQLAELYAIDAEGYARWQAAYQEMKLAKQEFDSLSKNNESPEAMAASLARLEKAKQSVKEAAPKKTFFTEITDQIGKIGASGTLSMKQFVEMSENSARELVFKLRAAADAKEKLEKLSASKAPFEQQILALKEILNITREIEVRLAKAALNENDSVQNNPDLDFTRKVRSQQETFGRAIPDQIARSTKATAEWLARDARIGKLEKDLDGSTGKEFTQFEYAKKRAQLERERKAQSKFEDVMPDLTTSTLLSNLSNIGAGFSLQELLNIPTSVRKSLTDSANEVAKIDFHLGKYNETDPKKLASFAKTKVDALNNAGIVFRKYANKSLDTEMSGFNDAGFDNMNLERFAKLKDNPVLSKLATDAANLKAMLGESNLDALTKNIVLTAKIELDAKIKQINLDERGVEAKFKGIIDTFQEFGLTTLTLGRMTQTSRSELESYSIAIAYLKEDISKLGNSAEDTAKALEKELLIRELEKKALNAAGADDFVRRGTLGTNRTNKLFEEINQAYSGVGTAADILITDMRNKLDSQMEIYAKEQSAMTPEQRKIAIEIIRDKKDKLDEAMRLETMRYKDTQAYAAGVSLASSTKDSIGNGIKDFMKGKASFKETIGNVARNFAEKIIDTYVDGMMSAVFKKNGIADKILTSIGAIFFGEGSNFLSSIFGGNGEPDPLLQANKDLEQAIRELTNALTGRISDEFDIPKTKKNEYAFDDAMQGTDIVKEATIEAGDNTSESVVNTGDKTISAISKGAKSQVDSIMNLGNSLRQITSGNPLSMINGVSGAINSVGNIAGAFSKFGGASSWVTGGLEGSLNNMMGLGLDVSEWMLADGGFVSGPGTATSDSIFAKLSNGEFVVNAESTRKHRKLLEHINLGGISKFAEGGLVGSPSLTPENAIFNTSSKELAPVHKKTNNQAVFNINITGDVSRQTRSEIQRMIPQIATGVNMHNREQGNRR